MDQNAVVQVISSVGFPIVACIGLAYFIANEIKQLREALNNNTLVIQKLLDKLDTDEDVR